MVCVCVCVAVGSGIYFLFFSHERSPLAYHSWVLFSVIPPQERWIDWSTCWLWVKKLGFLCSTSLSSSVPTVVSSFSILRISKWSRGVDMGGLHLSSTACIWLSGCVKWVGRLSGSPLLPYRKVHSLPSKSFLLKVILGSVLACSFVLSQVIQTLERVKIYWGPSNPIWPLGTGIPGRESSICKSI